MIVFLCILLLLIIFVWLLFSRLAFVRLNFDSRTDELNARMNWLHTFLTITVKVNIMNTSSHLSVYLFNERVYSKAIKKIKGKRKMNWKNIRAFDLNSSRANVYYGLSNPFTTGITIGVVEFLHSYIPEIDIAQHPDFLAVEEYVYIDAETEMNLGKTFVNILRSKINEKGEIHHGSIQFDRKRRHSVSQP